MHTYIHPHGEYIINVMWFPLCKGDFLQVKNTSPSKCDLYRTFISLVCFNINSIMSLDML